jgi:hypothetical protein
MKGKSGSDARISCDVLGIGVVRDANVHSDVEQHG